MKNRSVVDQIRARAWNPCPVCISEKAKRDLLPRWENKIHFEKGWEMVSAKDYLLWSGFPEKALLLANKHKKGFWRRPKPCDSFYNSYAGFPVQVPGYVF